MRRLEIDYSQPPVLLGTPVPLNGEWVDGAARFKNFRFGQIDGPIRVWVWDADNNNDKNNDNNDNIKDVSLQGERQ